MADSSFRPTPSAALDSRTVGSEHRQVVCIGDPTTNANVLAVNASGQVTVLPGNTANTTAWLVSVRPATTGGHSFFSASVTAAASIKASAGQVYAIDIHNTTAAVAYLQMFNTLVGSVTLGTTPPVLAFGVPANGHVTVPISQGLAFSTAIVVGATTTRTGSTTAALDINVAYT